MLAHSFVRALLVSYLHDCCHSLYFSMSPSFRPAEIDISLPCDDGLWNAGSATRWFQTVKAPSHYGHGFARLSGFSLQRALAILSEPQPTALPVLNSFSHFILIHAILRNLYASGSSDQTDDLSLSGYTIDTKASIQCALHVWLQMWMNNPDTIRYDNSREEPPFVYNALPFYWLAQALLVVFRNEGVDLKQADCKNQSWYHLMKEWLDKIKSHLRDGTQIPMQLWDELMNIRCQIQQRPGQGRADHPGGLASFFQRPGPGSLDV